MSESPLVSTESAGTGVGAPIVVEAILVPLDGSEFAERAVPVASRLAERLDAEIHLLSAVAHENDSHSREADIGAVGPTTGRIRRSVVVDVDPARAIREYLEGLTHPMVCMASHGRGRSVGIVGSVASELVARSDDPLVIAGPRIGDIAPWVQDGIPSSGVVACVDETPASASLLPVALGWAKLFQEPAVVVTVAEPVPSAFAEVPTRRRFGPDGDPEAFLDSLIAPVRASGVAVETRVIWDPISPAEGMRSYLHEHPASLVVVNSHTRHGLARIVFGSAAAGIIHASPSPVLVVPRPDGS